MNFLTSGIVLYSFYQCICMNPDGSEPERGNSGIRLYGPGDPVFATTLKLTPNESGILHNLLKSHENKTPKEAPEGTVQSGIDLDKIRRTKEGMPLFVLTLELNEEEAEILKKLLETQDKSGDEHDPSPPPSAPPEERPPPYAPGYAPPQQGPSAPPGPGYVPPQQGYTGATGGYGSGYPTQGPYGPPGATGPPTQGYTGGAGGYGGGHPPQGPYGPPAHGGYGQPTAGYGLPTQGYTGGAGGYGGGHPPQGPYGPPAHGGYGQPTAGYGLPVQGYTGGVGGYGGGYPPSQGPSAPPGATGPYGTQDYGQQGAAGYTPPEGQGPTDPGDDPSGPSDPSGLPTKGKGGEILVPLETKDTESSNSVEVLEYKIPGSGGKHRKHKAKEGFGFNVVTHGNTEVWTMSDSCHATDVTVIGVGKPSKKMDIKLSNGTRKRFGKGGKNKPWKPEVEKK